MVDFGGGSTIAVYPKSGDYANETRFLTDQNAHESVAVRVYEGVPKACAVFADGLQRLAIVELLRAPHAPLFEKLFATLRQAGPAVARK